MYKNMLISLFSIVLLAACGGSTGSDEGPGIDDNGGGSTTVELQPLNIDETNYDGVLSYAYSIPDSMLQIGQLVAELASDYSLQEQTSFSEICENGGNQTFTLVDNNGDGLLSELDSLQLNFSNCGNELLDTVVDGQIDVLLLEQNTEITRYQSGIDIDISDEDISFAFSGNIKVDVTETDQNLNLHVYNNVDPTVLSLLGFEEKIESFSVYKTIATADHQYSIGFTFDMVSEILEGRFSCTTLIEMTGTVNALPVSYNFDCHGENSFDVTTTNTNGAGIETFVNVPFADGHHEIIHFSQENYFDGSLVADLNLGGNVDVDFDFSFAEDVAQLTFDDMGQTSGIAVDKENHVAFVAGMVFDEDHDGVLYKVNLADMSVISAIDLDGRVHRMSLSDNGQQLYIIELQPGAGSVNPNVAIYDTSTLVREYNVNIENELLPDAIIVNQHYIDIQPLPGSADNWVVQIAGQGSNEAVVALYSADELIESSVTTRSTNPSVGYSSLYVESQTSIIIMETNVFAKEISLSRLQIVEGSLIPTAESTITYLSGVVGLNESDSYQIQFSHEDKIYIDNGFVINVNDLSFSHRLPVNRPALSVELGRIFDLNSEEITAFSLFDGSQLFSSDSYERPWSNRGYTTVNGGPGYMVMASNNFVLRVGKTLLP